MAAAVGIALVVAMVVLMRACAPAPTTVRAVAVGGMVCDPRDPQFAGGDGTVDGCRHQVVSDAAVALSPDALLGLGDYLFEVPDADAYATHYDGSWGRLRDVTIPALGNQELKVNEANTYRAYFGARAAPAPDYWATDLGAWRVIVLNSNCTSVPGGCAEGSPQHRWLAEELAASSARCTVALWHHPRWSNGIAGADRRTADLVDLMVAHGVDLGLSAHEADYERFRPMDARGRADDRGIRTFVVGAGGQAVYRPEDGRAAWRARNGSPGSEHFDGTHHGFLELTLAPAGYTWRYHALVDERAGAVRVVDSGSAACS